MASAVNYSVPSQSQHETPKQEHVHRVFVEMVSSKPSANSPFTSLTTSEKVIRVAAYILISIGILFLVASTVFFGAGAVAGAQTSAMLFGETVFPFGVVALIGGVHLLNPLKINSKIEPSIRFGPLTASL